MAEARKTGTYTVKKGLAQMQKGGVIMDVTTPEHAKIAEDAGAVAVMALHLIPSDIREKGGIARTAYTETIEGIMKAVTIPVMAKARIGHYGEAEILQELGVDYVDESEVLSPADDTYHIYKKDFKVPFVCGARSLGEALMRINEGAAMIRTKGEPGTGDVKEAVRHMRRMRSDFALVIGYDLIEKHFEQPYYTEGWRHWIWINKTRPKSELEKAVSRLEPEQLAYVLGMLELGREYERRSLPSIVNEEDYEQIRILNMDNELMAKLNEYGLPMEAMDLLKQGNADDILKMFDSSVAYGRIKELSIEWGVTEELVRKVAESNGLPVVNFAAGGIATPADAALMMHLGADGIFVGSGIFKSGDPAKTAKAIVEATTFFSKIEQLTNAQRAVSGIEAMKGIDRVAAEDMMQTRTT